MPQVHEKVRQAVQTGECVLFLGAAVHACPPQGSPYVYSDDQRPLQAWELTERLATDSRFTDEFPRDRYPGDFPPTLQRVSLYLDTPKGGGRRELVRQLRQHLQAGKVPSPALRALAELPFRIIVTTNYDNLLETALRDAGKDPEVLVYQPKRREVTPDASEEPSERKPLVFKIHGDIAKADSIVITDEDYIHFVCRMTEQQYHAIPDTVLYRMKKWPTLFLGYSLRDYNLRTLFRTIRWTLDEADFPLSYSIDHSPDPLIKQFWESERNYVFFVVEELWTFVPQLYSEVIGHPLAAGPSQS